VKDPFKGWGSVYIRTKFLLFPKVIRREWKWLKTASWAEEYVSVDGWETWERVTPIRWLEKEKVSEATLFARRHSRREGWK
jgi:hypothetical protein